MAAPVDDPSWKERRRLYGQMNYQAQTRLTGEQLLAYRAVSGDQCRRELLGQWLQTGKDIVAVIRSRFELKSSVTSNRSQEHVPLTRREIFRKFGKVSGSEYIQELEAEGSYEVDFRAPHDKNRWRYQVWEGTRSKQSESLGATSCLQLDAPDTAGAEEVGVLLESEVQRRASLRFDLPWTDPDTLPKLTAGGGPAGAAEDAGLDEGTTATAQEGPPPASSSASGSQDTRAAARAKSRGKQVAAAKATASKGSPAAAKAEQAAGQQPRGYKQLEPAILNCCLFHGSRFHVAFARWLRVCTSACVSVCVRVWPGNASSESRATTPWSMTSLPSSWRTRWHVALSFPDFFSWRLPL